MGEKLNLYGVETVYREGNPHKDIKEICIDFGTVRVKGVPKTKEMKRTLRELKYRLNDKSDKVVRVYAEKATLTLMEQARLKDTRCMICVYDIEDEPKEKAETIKSAANMISIAHRQMSEAGYRVCNQISAYYDGTLLIVVRKVALDDNTD